MDVIISTGEKFDIRKLKNVFWMYSEIKNINNVQKLVQEAPGNKAASEYIYDKAKRRIEKCF